MTYNSTKSVDFNNYLTRFLVCLEDVVLLLLLQCLHINWKDQPSYMDA